MPLCIICKKEQHSITNLKLHLQIDENYSLKNVFRCQEHKCFQDFDGWENFRKHLYNTHKFPVKTPLNVNKKRKLGTFKVNEEGENTNYLLSVNTEDTNAELLEHEPNIVTITDLQSIVEKSLTAMLGKIYSCYTLPRSYAQTAVNDIQELFKNVMQVLKSLMVQLILNDQAKSEEKVAEVDEIFYRTLEPFVTFSSEYRRLKFFTDSESYVEPQGFIVGQKIDDKLVDDRMVKEMGFLRGQYISVSDTLKKFFRLPGVLASTMKYIKDLELELEGQVMSNFVQGKLWLQKKSNYFSGKTVLPIFIFFDDFEVNNPLGSHSGIQKLGAVYFTVPCIPPEFRS